MIIAAGRFPGIMAVDRGERSPAVAATSAAAVPCRHPGGTHVMATVREILERKGSQVFTIGKDATVLEAALVMNQHKIGSLVVLEGDQVVGMFTERDVLRRVVGERRDPAGT